MATVGQAIWVIGELLNEASVYVRKVQSRIATRKSFIFFQGLTTIYNVSISNVKVIQPTTPLVLL